MVAHSLHRHSESLVNTLERVALRVVQEIMRHQYSPTGPALGSLRGELPSQTRPPVPYAFATPEQRNSPAYVIYKVGGCNARVFILFKLHYQSLVEKSFKPFPLLELLKPTSQFSAVPKSRSLFLFFRGAARPFSFCTNPAISLHHHRVAVSRVRLPGRDRQRRARVLSFLFLYFV
jgi:hypothetical protein